MTEPMFTEEQKAVLRKTTCKDVPTDDDFKLFVQTCERTQLDPFARQIFPVVRNEKVKGTDRYAPKMTIQVSIDGFRLVAQRTGEYSGQSGPHWCGEDGVWRDVWLEKDPPMAARVGVYRRGFVEALFAVARYDGYVQEKNNKPTGLWAKMPELMIGKCAEALALRRAFPAELSGLYTSDEMGQAANPPAAHAVEAAPAKVEPERRKEQEGAESAVAAAIAGDPTATKAIDALLFVKTSNDFLVWAGRYVPLIGSLGTAEKGRLWKKMVETGGKVGFEERDVRAILDETQAATGGRKGEAA